VFQLFTQQFSTFSDFESLDRSRIDSKDKEEMDLDSSMEELETRDTAAIENHLRPLGSKHSVLPPKT
jgi:hypothetical protein